MKEKEFLKKVKKQYPESEITKATDHYKAYIGSNFTTIRRHPAQEIPSSHER